MVPCCAFCVVPKACLYALSLGLGLQRKLILKLSPSLLIGSSEASQENSILFHQTGQSLYQQCLTEFQILFECCQVFTDFFFFLNRRPVLDTMWTCHPAPSSLAWDRLQSSCVCPRKAL